MIKPNELASVAFAEPFEPFRIHMASGRKFDIRHPEFVKVGRSTFTIYTTPEGDADSPPRWETLSLMLCGSLSSLGQAPAANGQHDV